MDIELLYAMWAETNVENKCHVEFWWPENTSGISLNEMFEEIEWEVDLETLRLYA